jgi:hypothetical protein
MLRATLIVWQVLPKLRFVQFPWRWMSILAVPFAFFLAAVAVRRFGWLWVTTATVVLAGTGAFLVRQTWWDADDIPTLQAGMAAGEGFEGTDEYDPVGDDHYNLPAKMARARVLPMDLVGEAPTPRIYFERWTAEDREIRVVSPGAVRLALRLLNYPAWHVEVNGKTVMPEHAEDSGQVVLELPSGESRVKVHFARTRDRTLGGALSLMSLLASFFLLLRPTRA